MNRVTLDTNIYVSAFEFGGPMRLLQMGMDGEVDIAGYKKVCKGRSRNTQPNSVALATLMETPNHDKSWGRCCELTDPASRPMTKTGTAYVRLGSRMVRPFTWEKWRRLNVARVLPRCKAVAATIRS